MKHNFNKTTIEAMKRIEKGYELSFKHIKSMLEMLSPTTKIEIANKVFYFDGDENGLEIDYIHKINEMYKDGYELLEELGLFEDKIAYYASYSYAEGVLAGSSLKLLNESELEDVLTDLSEYPELETLIILHFNERVKYYHFNKEEEKLLDQVEMEFIEAGM